MEPLPASDIQPRHFGWRLEGKVALIVLDRPERKNALTLDSYRELTDIFRKLAHVPQIKAVVITGAGENFCSGGDVHDIIGPLVEMRANQQALLSFTRMSGELVRVMRACPQPIVAAVDGVCTGAGAIIAMASDIRFGTSRSRIAFLFVKVGLSGADMGACAILPRIVGQGRAAELLHTGRFMNGEEAERWGFYNRLAVPEQLISEATCFARELADGPTVAHAITKKCLHQEWNVSIEEAIEAEAQAQAECMQSEDFARAYHAFVARQSPKFEGN